MAERRKFLYSVREAVLNKQSNKCEPSIAESTSSGETPICQMQHELFSAVEAINSPQHGPSNYRKIYFAYDGDEIDLDNASEKDTSFNKDFEKGSDDSDLDPTFSPYYQETTEDDSEFETEKERNIGKKKRNN